MRRIIKRLFLLICILALLTMTALLLGKALRTFYPIKYKDLVHKYSDQYNLDPYLVLAVIKVESSFRHSAVSPKDARGLMQITEGTGKWGAERLGLEDYTKERLFEPEVNIRMGCWYLSTLYKEFGDTELVLAAYNAGSGNVSKWLADENLSRSGKSLDKIPYRETEKYVKKVKTSYEKYKKLYENEF